MTAADVIAGRAGWACEAADALDWLRAMPDDAADLLACSPPYEAARTYSIGFALAGQAWVDWMAEVVRAAAPKVKGLIAVVCEGQTRDFRYSCTPFLLAADLHRAGFHLRKPVAYHRVGIPGSGGPDWLRNDWEPIVCVTRPGRLPWADNTACGHPPRWAPGGEMAHRLTDGQRVNQWGKTGAKTRMGSKSPGGKVTALPGHRPSHVVMTRKREGTHSQESTASTPPAVANPGNTPRGVYTADEVAALLAEAGNVTHHAVGGNQMGHPLAHENEAPFPLALAEFFVKSFAPPGGLVIDPFAGSGTTCHAAVLHGRRFAGCDVRASQAELCRRRMATVTPSLFAPGGPA